jgi:hypothetical protein
LWGVSLAFSPLAQFQEERARRQAEVFARLYEDGKRVAEGVLCSQFAMLHATSPRPLTPCQSAGPQTLLSFTQKDYQQQLALQPWNPWSPGYCGRIIILLVICLACNQNSNIALVNSPDIG